MSAQGNARMRCHFNRASHNNRIAGMGAAGDVAAAYQRDDLGIAAQGVTTEAFP
jgi:hypothetical protein